MKNVRIAALTSICFLAIAFGHHGITVQAFQTHQGAKEGALRLLDHLGGTETSNRNDCGEPVSFDGEGDFELVSNVTGRESLLYRIKLTSLGGGSSLGNLITRRPKRTGSNPPLEQTSKVPIEEGQTRDIAVGPGNILFVDSGSGSGSTNASGTYQLCS